MLLQIEERQIEPGIAVIALTGRFALGRESQRVEAMVDSLVKAGRKRAILDLSGVDYIDSAGIGLVALAAGRLKEAGGKLAVVAKDGRVLDMLKMTQVDKLFPVRDTLSAAAELLGEAPPASAHMI